MRLGTSGLAEHGFPSINRTMAFYRRALSSSFELVTVADDEPTGRPDAVLNFGGSRWWRERPRPRCPIVFAMHGGPILDPQIASLVDHLTTADVMLVNCSSDVTILSQLFDGRAPTFCQLDLPVDTSVFRPFDTAKSQELIGLGDADHVIGFVARLIPQKNLHLFLRIVAEVCRRLAPRRVRALIIGDYWADYPVLGYATADYPRFIPELISELGLDQAVAYSPAGLDDSSLAVAYSAMDVLVHPTNAIDENFGYTPVEAMACGTPVVGTAYGGLKDTIVHAETGYLVPTWTTNAGIRTDIDDAVARVCSLLDDPDRLALMARTAAQVTSERFSPARCEATLSATVSDAIDTYRAVPEPVSLAPPPDSGSGSGSGSGDGERASLLPTRVEPPWEWYRPRVDHYTSRSVPTIGECSAVRLQAPLVAQGPDGTTGSGYRLDDPAWPALYQLDEHQFEVAKRASHSLAVDTARELASDDELNQMLNDGVLVGRLDS